MGSKIDWSSEIITMMRFSGRIKGRVQGVGFRAFTQKIAHQYQLSGWVKNQMDGSVLLEAQGDDQSLKEFMDALRNGPVFSKVEEAVFKEQTILKDEVDFMILR